MGLPLAHCNHSDNSVNFRAPAHTGALLFCWPCGSMLPMSNPWALDRRLAADTVAIGDLPLCRVLLNDDGNFPWLILVPRREGAIELIDLDEATRVTLMA